MKKNIEDQLNIPNKRKQIERSLSKNQRIIPNQNKNRPFFFNNVFGRKKFRRKKRTFEEKRFLKNKLINQLNICRKIKQKTIKKVFKKTVSKQKNFYLQIKYHEKKNQIDGKNIIKNLKKKTKENRLTQKKIIEQIKSQEKKNHLAERNIIEELNSEKQKNRLAEKKIIEEIQKLFDQINNEEKIKSSNDLENIKKISDEKRDTKILAKKNIKEKKKIYNEKRILAKKIIEKRKKIYDEKKKKLKKNIKKKKTIYNKKKNNLVSLFQIIQNKKKIYYEKKLITKAIIKNKSRFFSKEKIKALQNINKIKIFWKMWQARVQMGERKGVWNPKMAPYIFPKKKYLYQTINIVKTYKYLKKVCIYLYKAAKRKKTVLFVGTNFPRLTRNAARTSRSFFVTKRWLGGILTNWKTIKKSNKRYRNIRLKEKLKTIPLHLKLKRIFRNLLKKHSNNKIHFLKNITNKKRVVFLSKLFKDDKINY